MSKLRIARLEVGGFTCGEFFAAVSLPESVVSTLETKSGISFLAMAQGFGALLSLSSDGKPYVGIPLHVRLLNYDSIRGMFRRLDTHARKAFIERICVEVLCSQYLDLNKHDVFALHPRVSAMSYQDITYVAGGVYIPIADGEVLIPTSCVSAFTSSIILESLYE